MLFWTGYPVLSETRPPHKTSCTGPKGGLTCEVLLYTIIYIITSFHTSLYTNTHACAGADPENCKGGVGALWVGPALAEPLCTATLWRHNKMALLTIEKGLLLWLLVIDVICIPIINFLNSFDILLLFRFLEVFYDLKNDESLLRFSIWICPVWAKGGRVHMLPMYPPWIHPSCCYYGHKQTH